MAFYVGQKVVMVDLGEAPDPARNPPPFNRVITVSQIHSRKMGHNGYRTTLEFVEYPGPETEIYYPGWNAEYFRPAVERKTDISIFTAMLTPKRQSVDA